ncbi:Tim44 domain-containing protein [Syntrophobacter fumaroxidans]|uniref:Import inner membrane translocase, subunit Tim44 n=1 Tax=Syntrophobacter fumaroxidans (strain DSM 10017 / MPOB) TaxID=335543 RepID=A0LJ73_SYNFM|nr:Tim44 domain-containing protein [Syntrophobacter fumaroxidans]ABK17475.1 import inner membrane translocase, subunit Tim44 [Syntrophobacter fumaroxidans MPOB]
MKKKALYLAVLFSIIVMFCVATLLESSAWARAGGGSSSGSRGSRSFSAPSAPPSRPSPGPSPSSPGFGTPGSRQIPGSPPPSTGFSRSPFWQGMAGGLAGGLIGNMLFGGRGYAGPGGGGGGGYGGPGLLDLLIIGVGIYFLMKFLKRRREQQADTLLYSDSGMARPQQPYYGGGGQPEYLPPADDVERGFQELRRFDPGFNEESFKETVQDLFFRIQAGWMNRSLDGIEGLLAPEMKAFFASEFDRLRRSGRINKLENIAVRKVEPSEVWQEEGKDYVTVLFTANLLDYTVDDKTGQVVEGDKLNPVKFQEFWTFCRDIGTQRWQLTAINQMNEPLPHLN